MISSSKASTSRRTSASSSGCGDGLSKVTQSGFVISTGRFAIGRSRSSSSMISNSQSVGSFTKMGAANSPLPDYSTIPRMRSMIETARYHDAPVGFRQPGIFAPRKLHSRLRLAAGQFGEVARRRRIASPPGYFFSAPKTFWSRSVVRATGFCRICCSSSATILNSPSMALLVT